MYNMKHNISKWELLISLVQENIPKTKENKSQKNAVVAFKQNYTI